MGVKAKRVMLICIILLIVLQLAVSVSAAPKYKGSGSSSSDNIFVNALYSVMDFFKLDFFNNDVDRLAGFMRITIGIIVFSAIYWGFSALNGGGGNAVPQGVAITIGIVIALITVVFLPNHLLFAMGSTTALVAVLLFFGFILMSIYGVYRSIGFDDDSRAKYIILSMMCVVFLIVLFFMRGAAKSIIGLGAIK